MYEIPNYGAIWRRAAVRTAGPGSRLLWRFWTCPGQGCRRGGQIVHCLLFLLLLPRPEFSTPREAVRAARKAERVKSSSCRPRGDLGLPASAPHIVQGLQAQGPVRPGRRRQRADVCRALYSLLSAPLHDSVLHRKPRRDPATVATPQGLGFLSGSPVPPPLGPPCSASSPPRTCFCL